MIRIHLMKLVVGTGLATLLAAPGAIYGAKNDISCKAKLDEASEVPLPNPVFGTTGKARVDFSENRAEATYRLKVNDGLRLFMAHVHCAPEGATGPIIVWLAGQPPPPTGWDVNGNWVRNTTLDDEDVFDNIPGSNNCVHQIANLRDLANACLAGDCYVNVHSRDNPSGQIRGQLSCKGEDDKPDK